MRGVAAKEDLSQGHPDEWREDWKDPGRTTPRGFIRWMNLSDEEINQVAELIAEGIPRHEAARRVGTSNTQLYRLEKRRPDVAERFYQASQEGKAAFQDHIRADLWFHAFIEKNYKALRDLGIMHLPEMEPFRAQRLEISNVDGEAFKMAAIQALGPEPEKEKLETLLRLLEDAKPPRELEAPE